VSDHSVHETTSETKRSPALMRTDVGRIRRGGDPKIGLSLKVLDALRAGEPLHPPMAPQERIALAVTSTHPTHHLNITSPSEPPRKSWRRFLLSGLSRSCLLVLDGGEFVAAAV
jgi:hypothetical protein